MLLRTLLGCASKASGQTRNDRRIVFVKRATFTSYPRSQRWAEPPGSWTKFPGGPLLVFKHVLIIYLYLAKKKNANRLKPKTCVYLSLLLFDVHRIHYPVLANQTIIVNHYRSAVNNLSVILSVFS